MEEGKKMGIAAIFSLCLFFYVLLTTNIYFLHDVCVLAVDGFIC